MAIWDKIQEHVIGVFVTAVFAILSVVLAWNWESFVGVYIQPQIQQSFERDGYFREEIKNGQFVVTDDNEFAKNEIIPSDKLENLKNDVFASKKSVLDSRDNITDIESTINKRLDSLFNENSKLQQRLDELEKENHDLRSYLNVIASKKLKVELFVSERDADKGKIVLNLRNPIISTALENNSTYKVYGANGDYERLTTRIEVLTHNERSKNAVIGRVHQDDYHDLFDGATSGARYAYIALK
ncbi:TPA: hypothetical protein JG821_004641 [Vibrio parahaemolyticus]|uniref:hypothetical protein n=1 Tax=Vibrio parahaemolyticus TaxID=670 RepID=UPI001123D72C|nr:hypothetical protein [Vibrio parahaemolyticus]ELB2184805.1 hypothetical protein [Vibrio parahaemolyticus]MBE4422419.1 hypothetical protein [Vibrio parahaemolyticus]TOJ09279.1 hypothetical protein CGI45_24715 [Vibrio parahaemolyticus]HAS6868439.1 hypothetical protein [Vibrio parahaemolyticus]HAV1516335.1 hypothetical protein [Vibrio parahaemolyticus]